MNRTIYTYGKKGIFTGVGEADLCPVTEERKQLQIATAGESIKAEDLIESVLLVPANATTIAPPSNIPEGEAAYFVRGKWVVMIDSSEADRKLKEEKEKAEAEEYEKNLPYNVKRAREYPAMTDYLDAVVKGDKEAMKKYIDACKAVKAKYPKPVEAK